MRTFRAIFAAALVTITFAACGGSGGTAQSTDQPTERTTTTSHANVALEPVDGLVATARAGLAVYASTDATSAAGLLGAHTTFGSPTTMLVQGWQGESGSWLRVLLPTRPNGATGYVRMSDVTLARVDQHVDVDLGTRHLQVTDGSGAVIIDTAIATGSAQNPTPTGKFFVTDVIDTQNDGGAYGPFAIGLSAHSDTLSEFAGGDGEIGIHGTNDPSSIGNAVSHGCIRVPNDVAVQLAQLLALGTPVTIH
jgi:hypothetical protein